MNDMKVIKLFSIILLLVLILPLVNATIDSSSLTSSIYNLGDKILVEGTVTSVKDIRTNLDLFLDCGSQNVQVTTTLLNLKADQPSQFSNLITLPTTIFGRCSLMANLVDLDGNSIESKNIGSFELSNKLKTGFEINKKGFQLGDTLIVKGSVLKQSGLVADGVLVLSFRQDKKVILIDTIEVIHGLVDYKKVLTKITPGNYFVDVLVKDNFGNFVSFDGLFNFVIDSNLNVNTVLDKNFYSPGDSLNLNGYVSSNLNNQLRNINLDFDFDDIIRNAKLSSNAETFSVNYIISEKIKSGSHSIGVVAYDDDGNYAAKAIEFNVQPIPTVLSLDLVSSSYDPEQSVEFTVFLYDQAGDEISESVNVDLLNNKGKVVSSKAVRTGVLNSFILPKAAIPGLWKVVVSGLGLGSEVAFNVREYKKLDANIQGTNLVVDNTGNVPYKGLLDIKGNELVKSKNINLKVGDKDEIKLDKLFSPGFYNFTIPFIGKYFDSVSIPKSKSLFSSNKITGNVAKNVSSTGRKTMLFAVLIVLCCGILYLLFIAKKNRANKIKVNSSQDDYLLAQKKLDELRTRGIRKDSPKTEYGKATQEDVEDWKRRLQQSIREHEKMNSHNEFVRHQQSSNNKDKPSGGLFNMFN